MVPPFSSNVMLPMVVTMPCFSVSTLSPSGLRAVEWPYPRMMGSRTSPAMYPTIT